MQYEITDELLYRYMPLVDEAIIRRIEEELSEVTLSESFRERMEAFLRSRKRRGTVLRYLVSLAAVLLISFSVAIGVNAEFRAKVIGWFISDRGEYSIVHTKPVDFSEASFDELKQYEVGYVPEGYEFYDMFEMQEEGIDYIFSNEEGTTSFDVILTMPDFENMMINTEGMEKEELWYRDAEAFYYHGGIVTIFICSVDGYPVYIFGSPEITKEELLKVADGIHRKE